MIFNIAHPGRLTEVKMLQEEDFTELYTFDELVESVMPVAKVLWLCLENGAVGVEDLFHALRRVALDRLNRGFYAVHLGYALLKTAPVEYKDLPIMRMLGVDFFLFLSPESDDSIVRIVSVKMLEPSEQ